MRNCTHRYNYIQSYDWHHTQYPSHISSLHTNQVDACLVVHPSYYRPVLKTWNLLVNQQFWLSILVTMFFNGAIWKKVGAKWHPSIGANWHPFGANWHPFGAKWNPVGAKWYWGAMAMGRNMGKHFLNTVGNGAFAHYEVVCLSSDGGKYIFPNNLAATILFSYTCMGMHLSVNV